MIRWEFWDFVLKKHLFCFGLPGYFSGLAAQQKCIHYGFQPECVKSARTGIAGGSLLYVEHFLKD